MADRLLVDLAPDGKVSVGTWLDGELPSPGEPCELAWPLDGEALEDLRWYLEDYLRAPFGVYGERGPQVEAALPGWGKAVFSAVFGSGPARDAYLRARTRGAPEMVFRSASPDLLGLPWELMADPGNPAPLALDGVSRSLPMAESAQTIPVPGGRLRVLMVISRPAGAGDVGYRMIARPLLERLEAVRGQVDLVVLRPPTLDALQETLAAAAQAGEPFQVVHFDGHGVLAGYRAAGAGAPMAYAGPGPEGVLVFEKQGGGPEEVPSSRVAQVLAAAGVPVAVLNACQSGAVGKDLEAAVATRLLKAGVASVVAMAYTVYAVAAAEFMAAFYERLFAGETVTEAVTAGRQRLYQRNKRPSPKGELPLADWLVPVHYLRRDVSFPQARTERSRQLPSLDQLLDAQREAASAQSAGPGDLDAVGTFVGRDGLFFQLETASRLQKVVVLHGPGGTGKTELAKAFGRWWRDTGGVGRPDWVFWHSFEPGVASFGLDGVITQIGLRLFGADFARLEPADRRAALLQVLTDHRMLLIWDNFESVRSMPDPGRATPPLDEAGCAELRDFLHELAARNGSAVLITSRTSEDWLGDVRRIQVAGLAKHEANEYADNLLAPYPSAAPKRSRRAFAELMEWLDGHPLSMRLILPRLETADPDALLAGLRGTAPLPGGEGTGRTTSLSASVSYSFAHLADATRRLLPAVCLFQSVADADVLSIFSRVPEVPARYAGAAPRDWAAALDDAAGVGLLTPLGRGMYLIHPALPGYLAAWWRREASGDRGHDREAAIRALLTAHGGLCGWLIEQINSGDAGLAYMVVALERRTLGSFLGYALDHELWEEADRIAMPLIRYWHVRGLDEEADAWTERVRVATEDATGVPPPLDSLPGNLWLAFIYSQVNRERERRHLDNAERTCRQILTALDGQPASPRNQRHRGAVYHELGWIAQNRGQLEEAAELYRKSLALDEERGDKRGVAASYHALGSIASSQGQRDEAEAWYRKSLAIKERLGDKPGMATTYHQLGILAQDRGLLDEAEDWYRKALALKEELGNKASTATTYHQLGNAAYLRERLDEAEDWYRRALAIWVELGDKPHLISTAGQFGLLAEKRGQPQQALEWTVRSVAMFSEFPHPATGPAPYHMARLTAQLGMDALEQTWHEVTGAPLPPAVRDYVQQQST